MGNMRAATWAVPGRPLAAVGRDFVRVLSSGIRRNGSTAERLQHSDSQGLVGPPGNTAEKCLASSSE